LTGFRWFTYTVGPRLILLGLLLVFMMPCLPQAAAGNPREGVVTTHLNTANASGYMNTCLTTVLTSSEDEPLGGLVWWAPFIPLAVLLVLVGVFLIIRRRRDRKPQ